MALVGFARISTLSQDLTAQLEQFEKFGCENVFAGKQGGAKDENERKLEEMIN